MYSQKRNPATGILIAAEFFVKKVYFKCIKNSETCYLLETKQDSPVGEKICVYEIDDVFYFVRFYDNGKVMRIHYAPIAQIEGCTNGALIFPTRVIE